LITISSFIETISDILGKICNVLILLINIFIFYEVIARYIFNSPTIWVTETCQYLLPALCFFGASYCLKSKGHIKVDLFVSILKKRTQNYIYVLVNFASLVFFIVLCWESYLFWREAYDFNFTSGSILDVRLWIPHIVFPVGLFFLCLQLIVEIHNGIIEIVK